MSLLFGWLALRGVALDDVREALRETDYIWLAPALLTLLISALMRCERWRVLFAEPERPGFIPAFWAMNVGYLFNNILPARAGEIIRVLVLARDTGLTRTHVLVTVVVERVFDLATLAVLLLCVVWLMPDGALVVNVAIASVVVLLAVAVMVGLLASARLRAWVIAQVRRLGQGRADRVERTIQSVSLGVGSLRSVRAAAPAVFWSFASWITLALSAWFALRAVVPDAPWHASLLALVAVNFAQIVPATAGGLGVFEAAARASLTAYGIDPAVALSFAFVYHALNLFPYLVLGAVGRGPPRHLAARLRARQREPAAQLVRGGCLGPL